MHLAVSFQKIDPDLGAVQLVPSLHVSAPIALAPRSRVIFRASLTWLLVWHGCGMSSAPWISAPIATAGTELWKIYTR
jgi:hypothetical protein